jgi:hypothetical protein
MPFLVIFDELALFEWIGHSALEVSRFGRALVASCAKASPICSSRFHSDHILRTHQLILQNDAFLVIRYHIATPDGLDSVLRILLQLSAYHIEVLPLSSGKSGAVSGEVRQVSFVPRVFL